MICESCTNEGGPGTDKGLQRCAASPASRNLPARMLLASRWCILYGPTLAIRRAEGSRRCGIISRTRAGRRSAYSSALRPGTSPYVRRHMPSVEILAAMYQSSWSTMKLESS